MFTHCGPLHLLGHAAEAPENLDPLQKQKGEEKQNQSYETVFLFYSVLSCEDLTNNSMTETIRGLWFKFQAEEQKQEVLLPELAASYSRPYPFCG